MTAMILYPDLTWVKLDVSTVLGRVKGFSYNWSASYHLYLLSHSHTTVFVAAKFLLQQLKYNVVKWYIIM